MTYVVRDAGGSIVAYYPEFEPPRAMSILDGEVLSDVLPPLVVDDEYVTAHGWPRVEPWLGDVPAAAWRLDALAEGSGFEVIVRDMTLRGVRVGTCVEGRHAARRRGFRAYWQRGRAISATWHAPTTWSLVEDVRPFAEPTKQTGLVRAGHRDRRGANSTRYVKMSSSLGLEVGVTRVVALVKGEG